jgi:SAM-dependent methyltransferase
MVEEKKEEAIDLVKLDLACGDNKREGFNGVDLYKTDSVDIQADLFKPDWPIESNSVDEVHCSHFIEHHPDLCLFWSELYRILKPGGKATIIAPFGKNNRAWQDPTHVRAIVEESFFYLDKNFRKLNKLEHYLADVDFEFVVAYLGIDPMWANRSEESRAFAVKHYWNVVSDIQAQLTKR